MNQTRHSVPSASFVGFVYRSRYAASDDLLRDMKVPVLSAGRYWPNTKAPPSAAVSLTRVNKPVTVPYAALDVSFDSFTSSHFPLFTMMVLAVSCAVPSASVQVPCAAFPSQKTRYEAFS